MYSVIVVDDERMIKYSLEKLIEDHPHFVVAGIASNGQEALALQEQHQAALIITDIRMPVMDGLQLIQALKARQDQAEIILLTGYAEFEYARQCLQMGAVDYLLKPVEVDQLYAALDRTYIKLQTLPAAPPSPRIDWVWRCKEYGSLLSELLWNTDSTALSEQLEIIREVLASEEAIRLGTSTAHYMELLHFVKQELARKSLWKIELRSEIGDFDGDIAELPSWFEQTLVDLMNDIRRSRSWGSRQVVEKAVDYLESNYQEETLTLKSTAARLGVSISYLSRSFSEEKGITFIQYLTQYRMSRASEYLQMPDLKTYEISQKVGYADYPHFARTFKKHYGISASSYRKKYLSDKNDMGE
ncbi:response regulator [Paenibacillus lemnae]|uniref:Response regulator n=1 Tax=Paenibacillus lemnae TaxID=1330551 RepID=A0A848M4R7_PAELE|nr:response regulator [Paenibacillus lemnae]NMO95249.1 response regulator [Paenibacillus lemnae]